MIVQLRTYKNGDENPSALRDYELPTGFGQAAIYRRLGRAKSFVIEVVDDSPVRQDLISAEIQTS
jgi:hypothetical protein